MDHFRSIALGLGIACENVDRGAQANPPERARELIIASDMLIGIVTRRDKLGEGDTFRAPPAVQEEVAMAYGLAKPILLFAESGVVLEGFFKGYCTIHEFDRNAIKDPEELRRAIEALHVGKLQNIPSHHVLLGQSGLGSFYSDQSRYLINLNEIRVSYIWQYRLTRKLIFTEDFRDCIRVRAWCPSGVAIDNDAEPIKYQISQIHGTKNFSFTVKEIVSSSRKIELELLAQARCCYGR